MTSMEVWRLGHVDGPLAPPPRERAGWTGRYDDPERRFLTFYAASNPLTAIREVLAALRPHADLVLHFGADSPEVRGARRVSLAEQDRSRRLASATVTCSAVVDLASPEGRGDAAERYADVLVAHGVAYLDDSDIKSRDRAFTQALAERLYAEGYDGVRYASNLDGHPCYAYFEDRYGIEHDPAGHRLGLPSAVPELMREAVAPLKLQIVP